MKFRLIFISSFIVKNFNEDFAPKYYYFKDFANENQFIDCSS